MAACKQHADIEFCKGNNEYWSGATFKYKVASTFLTFKDNNVANETPVSNNQIELAQK
jgi:hypothetical protein